LTDFRISCNSQLSHHVIA